MGQSYYDFMFGRSNAAPNQTLCKDGMGDALVYGNVGCTIFFCILNWSLPRLIKKLCPAFYNGLDKEKQESLPR